MSAPLSSVQNALRIIHLLRRRGALRVSDIAEELGVAVSTAHRLVSTLRDERFVRQESNSKRYELGPAMLFTGGTSPIEHCVAVATPVMRELRDATQETVHLSSMRGGDTVFLNAAESARLVRVSSRSGQHPEAHTTAAGKVLLAYLAEEQFEELFVTETLSPLTEHTITSRTALRTELEQVRLNGYARNLRESEEDMYTMAVPLRRPNGAVSCSLTLSVPYSRISVGLDELSEGETTYLVSLQNAQSLIEARLAF